MREQPNRTFVSAYAEALALLLNDSAWNESALLHVRGGLVDGNRSARHHNRSTARLKRAASLRSNSTSRGNATTRGNASRNTSRLVLN